MAESPRRLSEADLFDLTPQERIATLQHQLVQSRVRLDLFYAQILAELDDATQAIHSEKSGTSDVGEAYERTMRAAVLVKELTCHLDYIDYFLEVGIPLRQIIDHTLVRAWRDDPPPDGVPF